MNKYLLAAIKRDDTAENLSRYERQQELERRRKVQKIEERSKRLDDMQKEKEKISIQKRTLGNNLTERKKSLMDKVSNILTTGHFKSKEDIYQKVFNEEELQTLGYTMNKTTTSNNQSRMKKINLKIAKTEGNNEEKNNKNDDGFFLTQGNNPNGANTIGISNTHQNENNQNDEYKEDNEINENNEKDVNENNEQEVKEDNDIDENKEYNEEF